MKKFCVNCRAEEQCVIIANDMNGQPTVTICHRCGGRIT